MQETQKTYHFSYDVKDAKSGNDFGHRETSDGKVVSGEYHVKRPNGKLQKVKYSVTGETGLLVTFSDT